MASAVVAVTIGRIMRCCDVSGNRTPEFSCKGIIQERRASRGANRSCLVSCNDRYAAPWRAKVHPPWAPTVSGAEWTTTVL
jgi:hypothetical protein